MVTAPADTGFPGSQLKVTGNTHLFTAGVRLPHCRNLAVTADMQIHLQQRRNHETHNGHDIDEDVH